MGGRSWTEDDIAYLEYYIYSDDTKDYNAAAEFLNRSNGSVRKKAYQIRKNNSTLRLRKVWTEERLAFLKRWSPLKTDEWIAERLQTTKGAVERKRLVLGIRKNKGKAACLRIIIPLAKDGLTRREIAERSGLSYDLVVMYVKQENIQVTKTEQGAYFRRLARLSVDAARNKSRSRYNK